MRRGGRRGGVTVGGDSVVGLPLACNGNSLTMPLVCGTV